VRSGGGGARSATRPSKTAANEVRANQVVYGKNEATLALKSGRWTSVSAAHYNASVRRKSAPPGEAVPTSSRADGETWARRFCPALNLSAPAADAKADAKKTEGAGTRLSFTDKVGKPRWAACCLQNQRVQRASPLPINRNARRPNDCACAYTPNVLVMSDALKNASAKPEAWLAKDFFKADSDQSLAVRRRRCAVENRAQKEDTIREKSPMSWATRTRAGGGGGQCACGV